MFKLPEIESLRALLPDGRLLIVTRIVRMFGYGAISVILALYLAAMGLDERGIGLLLTATLVGDALLSLLIAGVADRLGRREMLLVGAGLIVLAGLVFALTRNIVLLIAAALVGTISPTGKEVGPSLSIEQAALAQTTTETHRTAVFGWYNLFASLATACGALISGAAATVMQARGLVALSSYRLILGGYAVIGLGLGLLFLRLSPVIEPAHLNGPAAPPAGLIGLNRSRGPILRLAGLFMVDAFGGGLIVQSLIAFWFYVRFGVEPALLGGIFFGAELLAAISSLAAARIARRIGLVNTMVFTHLPSNVLLMLVPLMPSLPLAIGVLLARFSISQMDVPTRQSYVMAVVNPDERSAAAGVTSIARVIASAIGPTLTGLMLKASLLSLPFFLAGGVKIVYDLALYRSFRGLKPPEEQAST